MSESQTCPRRLSDWGPWEREENLDKWDYRPALGGSGEPDHLSCSFCGSMHPNDFLNAIKNGEVIGPTDKSYKAYVKKADGVSDYGKFYYQHLDLKQRYEFCELNNEHKINIGYPGYFYVLPFFVRIEGRPDGDNVGSK